VASSCEHDDEPLDSGTMELIKKGFWTLFTVRLKLMKN
jgi:hypothetical protein